MTPPDARVRGAVARGIVRLVLAATFVVGGAGVSLAVLVATAPAASAHGPNGLFQPQAPTSTGPLALRLRVRLIYSNDTEPVTSGATVTAIATGPGGATAGPVTFSYTGTDGYYEAPMTFSGPGTWLVDYTATKPAASYLDHEVSVSGPPVTSPTTAPPTAPTTAPPTAPPTTPPTSAATTTTTRPSTTTGPTSTTSAPPGSAPAGGTDPPPDSPTTAAPTPTAPPSTAAPGATAPPPTSGPGAAAAVEIVDDQGLQPALVAAGAAAAGATVAAAFAFTRKRDLS